MTHPWKPDPAPPDFKTLGLDAEFARLARYYAKINAAEKQIAAEKAKTAAALKDHLASVNQTRASVENLRVTVVEGKAAGTKIDGQKLLEQGVSALVIQKATVTGKPGKPYILVTDINRPRKERGGDGEVEPDAEAA